MGRHYGHAMTEDSWRVDTIGDGTLAWLYLRLHEVPWSEPSAAVALHRDEGLLGGMSAADA